MKEIYRYIKFDVFRNFWQIYPSLFCNLFAWKQEFYLMDKNNFFREFLHWINVSVYFKS